MQTGGRATIQDLIYRATGGQKFNRRFLFRPSLVYRVLHDPFWIWCEYHAPRSKAVDETSRYQEFLWRRGVEHEEAWIRRHHPDAVKIEPSFGVPALRNTLNAMLAGAPAIWQAQLWNLEEEQYGKSDLLVRDDSRGSDLGPYHYRLVEIKSSRSLRDHHVFQAGFYNRTLGRIQGFVPDEMTVVLSEREEGVSYADKAEHLDGILAKWRGLRDGREIPEPGRPPNVTSSPWRVFGNRRVEEQKDLVLLAGVGKREREKLRRAGIHSIDWLWNLSLEDVRDLLGETYGPAAYYVAQSYRAGQPILKPERQIETPRARRRLYFDFETSDGTHPMEPAHVYLIGCWDAQRDEFVKFLAHGAEDEERIFAEFADYVGDGPGTCLYHWTDFEVGQMKKAMKRWPAVAGSLRAIISRCVDLKEALQSAVYLPVPTFSIKSVAPALGFRWRQQGFGAFDSMVCYWDYLETGDRSAIDRTILYNEDDCLAMWHVDQELTKRLGGS